MVPAAPPPLPAYAELCCSSNFSFLHGASHAEELFERAAALGYSALAITDECSVAGVVRAHEAARQIAAEAGPQARTPWLVVGSRFRLQAEHTGAHTGEDGTGPELVVLARDRAGYGRLCELITLARSRGAKGSYRLTAADFAPGRIPVPGAPAHDPGASLDWSGCWGILLPTTGIDAARLLAQARWLVQVFGCRARIGVSRLLQADDALQLARAEAAAAASGAGLVALGRVRMHARSRRPLLDVMTAIRLRRPVSDCGLALPANAEQRLRPRAALARLYRPEWLAESVHIARDCRAFSLDQLRYEYPDEIVPAGHSATSWLRACTQAGAARRWPQGVPADIAAQIERELALIAELRYEAFFLTVHDIVAHARSLGILCQGRGSAANSVVCYCLGITEVDPAHGTLLFERFISRERAEPPDIDVDFEHERREEVIDYIQRKYGAHRSALAAAVSTYRTRGALRETGRALGLDEALIDAVARAHQWFDDPAALEARLAEQGLDAQAPVTRQWLALARTLMGMPRHLSQHSGGFVIARDSLARLVPIEPAAMDGRRVIQWDKDDLESLGLLKVDVLALGMLTVLRKALALADARHGRLHGDQPWTLQHIPRDCPATWAMIQRADTVGTFQIESRAQMSMLPRLKPEKFYDLVIEVAIVRPGPIQGGMVHPYLKRKRGLEPATLPDARLAPALARTLGVPIFQEQVMQVCTIAAGFSPGEADNLRRAMAAWRRKGGVHHFHERIVEGMVARGYAREFAQALFRQIQGFGEYGFPESHAHGFALLAWASAWLKCHEPAAFLAALLNSQPMGFYAPAQLVADARRHGVELRPVDVNTSDWDCTLEATASDTTAPDAAPAVRLGLRQIAGLAEAVARRIVQARQAAAFADVADLARRAGLDAATLQRLARADALSTLAGHRRAQVWAAAGTPRPANADLFDTTSPHEPGLALAEAPEGEAILLDHHALGLSLRRHPLALLRERLRGLGVRSAAELATLRDGRGARACGLVTTRQQPATAKGTIFVTLDDETGPVNVIVWKDVRERHRAALLGARLLLVRGTWQQHDGVGHLLARELHDLSAWVGTLAPRSRDFH